MEGLKKNNRVQLLSIVVIGALTCICILLILQNKELKASFRNSSPFLFESLKPGDKVESVTVQSLDGATISLRYQEPEQKYLLFIFSTTCPHCENNLPIWNHIANLVGNKSGLNIIGIASEPLEVLNSFVKNKNPDFNICSAITDTSFGRKYGINVVPETIILTGDGTVIKTWIGELHGIQTEEVQTLLMGDSQSSN